MASTLTRFGNLRGKGLPCCGMRSRVRGVARTRACTGAAGDSANEGGRLAGVALFSGLVGATACLGVWQTQRYFWKLDLMAGRKATMAMEPVDLQAWGGVK
ncbi:unnamed protein product [Discosporangium mesarthrocarpum]